MAESGAGERERQGTSGARGVRADWTLLFLTYAVLVAAADALLLERTQTFFTAGFNAGHARGAPQVAAFFAAGGLVDLWLMVGVWVWVDVTVDEKVSVAVGVTV